MKETGKSEKNCRGAIILAGGDSKRLGQPKALLDFDGFSLIEVMVKSLGTHFQDITVVTDRPDLYRDLPVSLVGDLFTDRQKSPLRGIHAGLISSDLPYQFVVACDMPFLNLDLINYMAGFAPDCDAVVPRLGTYYQPLHSFYSRTCIDIIDWQVQRGCYKITDFYANLEIRFVDTSEVIRFDPKQESFININTRPDYEQALKIFLDRGKKAHTGGDKHAKNT